MYTEGIVDLNELVLIHPFLPPGEREASLAQIKDKAKNRYFPAFEKVSGSYFVFKVTKGLEAVLVIRTCHRSVGCYSKTAIHQMASSTGVCVPSSGYEMCKVKALQESASGEGLFLVHRWPASGCTLT